MAEDKYNRKNPAVKRILQEVKEMQSNPSDDFMSLPLEVTVTFLFTNPSVSNFIFIESVCSFSSMGEVES